MYVCTCGFSCICVCVCVLDIVVVVGSNWSSFVVIRVRFNLVLFLLACDFWKVIYVFCVIRGLFVRWG